MRRFRYLLLLVAFWLPLQTAYAVAMPFCRHAGEHGMALPAADAAAPCHQHETATDVAADQSNGCDDCAVCHLAGVGYLPAATAQLAPAAGRMMVSLPVMVPQSHIGDPPQQPPRRTN